MNIDQRAFGRLEQKVDTVHDDVVEMKKQLATLVAAANVAKGAKRATYAIAGAVGGGVSLAVSIIALWLK